MLYQLTKIFAVSCEAVIGCAAVYSFCSGHNADLMASGLGFFLVRGLRGLVSL